MDYKCGYFLNNQFVEIPLESIEVEYFTELKLLLKIKKVQDYPLVRIGTPDRDGGYIMVDDFENGDIAYSFGISDNIDWDNDMAEKGYQVFMYDHTINKLPFERNEFHFFKNGISSIAQPEKSLNTLEYYLEQNRHYENKNMILKIDVEGYEWDFLSAVQPETLNLFDQIIIEFHRMLNCKSGEKNLEFLKKLNETHQLIHLHGNNCGLTMLIGETFLADTVEATYVNREHYNFTESEIILPIALDKPNDPTRNDVILGKWNL